MNRALFSNRPANFMRGIALTASFLFLPVSVSAYTPDATPAPTEVSEVGTGYDDYLLATQKVGESIAGGITKGVENTAQLYRSAWSELTSLAQQGQTLKFPLKHLPTEMFGRPRLELGLAKVGPAIASYAQFSNSLGKTFTQTLTAGLGASQEFSQKIWDTDPYEKYASFAQDTGTSIGETIATTVGKLSAVASLGESVGKNFTQGIRGMKSSAVVFYGATQNELASFPKLGPLFDSYTEFSNNLGEAYVDVVIGYTERMNMVGNTLARGIKNGVKGSADIYTRSFAKTKQLVQKTPDLKLAINTTGAANISDIWNSTTNYFSNLWNNLTEPRPLLKTAPQGEALAPKQTPPKPVATPVAPSVGRTVLPTPSPQPANPPTQPLVIQNTVERILSGVTSADLELKIQQLRNELVGKIGQVAGQTQSNYTNNFAAIALTNKIDQLTNTTITTPTITGGSITNASISGGTISGTTISGTTLTVSSGTFSGNLTVSGTGTSTFAGDSVFDTDTLYIDSLNNRVGVGTTSPSDTFAVNGALYIANSSPSPTANRLYSSSNNLYWAGSLIGGATTGTWDTDGTHTWRPTGNVGIGTTSPYAKLSVVGEIVSSYFTATSTTASIFPYASTTALTVSGNSYLGTVSGGTWNGTAISAAYGGTGLSSYTAGDVLYASGPTTLAGTSTANLKTTLALNNVENTALSTWAGSTNLTTLGAITSGAWNAGALTSSGALTVNGAGNSYIAGNVGIGTTSPYAKLSVVGETVSSYFTATSTTATSTFNGGFAVGTGASPSGLVYDRSTGFVGIGTAAPQTALQVRSNADGNLWVRNAADFGGYTGLALVSYSDGVNPRDLLLSGNNVRLLTSGTEVLTMTSTERIGIGTTSPSRKLTVQTSTSNYGFSHTDGSIELASWIGLPGGGAPTGAWIGTVSNHPFYLYTNNNNPQVTLNTSGNLGIGTTSPYLPLSVTGQAVITATTTIGIGSTGQQAGILVGYGGICVDNDGTCTASTTGRVSAVSYTTGSTDLAENYTSSESLEPGDIVETRGGDTVGKGDGTSTIIGIVSTKPGIILGLDNDTNTPNQYPIALAGRVPVKVNLDGGEIKKGDHITLSSTPGIGQKATTSSYTVGIALEDFNSSTQGTILAFVNLAWSRLDPSISQGTIATVTGNESSFWNIDESSGRIKFIAALDLNDFNIINVSAIRGSAGKWSIDTAGKLVVDEVQARKVTAQEVTSQVFCIDDVCIGKDTLRALLEKNGVTQSAAVINSSQPTADNTQPTPEPVLPPPVEGEVVTEPKPEEASPPPVETSAPKPEVVQIQEPEPTLAPESASESAPPVEPAPVSDSTPATTATNQ